MRIRAVQLLDLGRFAHCSGAQFGAKATHCCHIDDFT